MSGVGGSRVRERVDAEPQLEPVESRAALAAEAGCEPEAQEPSVIPGGSDTLEYYTRYLHPTGSVWGKELTNWKSKIDKVPPALVGKMQIAKLRRVAPPWAIAPLSILLPQSEGGIDPPVAAQDDKKAQEMRSRPQRTVGGPAASAVQWLADPENGGLFEVHKGPVAATAGFFFVPKADDMLRTICDARQGNAHMSSEGMPFSLFSLETLINVMSKLSEHESIYVVNADLRHYYHQFKLPEKLRKFFVIRTVVNGIETVYVPLVMPMGWLLACLIAQSATWSMLLALHREKDYDCKVVLEVDLEQLHKLVRMPDWVPMRRGGGILSILDNMFIATGSAAAAYAWRDRISDACTPAGFGATLKLKKDEHELGVVRLQRNSDVSTDFLGVTGRHGCRRVKTGKGADDKVHPSLEASATEKVWAGTHRELGSVIGKLGWYHRVCGRNGFDERMQQFRSLYCLVNPSGEKSWDSYLTLTASETSVLKEHWQMRASGEWIPNRAMSGADRPLYGVVDAATTSHKIGVVVWRPTGTERVTHEPVALKPIEWNVAWTNIALGELMAIVHGVRQLNAVAASTRGTDNAALDYNVMVIATDSMTAKSWAQKMCANNAEANVILRLLSEELADRRLYLVYIPSADNPADAPSREEALDVKTDVRIARAWNLLQEAGIHAQGVWAVAGGRVGGMPKKTGL